MRALGFALLLLHSVAGLAQTTVGPEVLSDPLPFTTLGSEVAAPAVAMARDREGVAIAWMMPNSQGRQRLYVARLNATAHIEGAVHEVPVTSPYGLIEAVYPSLAASATGSGFALAWTELALAYPATALAVYCQLDSLLKPSVPAVLAPVAANAPGPLVRSGRATTWITASGFVWQLQADGTVKGPLTGGQPASDMTVGTDFPQLVSANKLPGNFTCNPAPGCTVGGGPFRGYCYEQCRTYDYSYLLHFTALYTAASTVRLPFNSDAQPAIQSDGRDVLVAWFDGAQGNGGEVVAARVPPASFASFTSAVMQHASLGPFARDAGQIRPDIATDGERYVVVWRTRLPAGTHDILGASIDREGNVTPLSIATSPADERDPSVVAIASGTFLVAYETFRAGERRIAGRFVTFGAHRRAVN